MLKSFYLAHRYLCLILCLVFTVGMAVGAFALVVPPVYVFAGFALAYLLSLAVIRYELPTKFRISTAKLSLMVKHGEVPSKKDARDKRVTLVDVEK